MTDSNSESPPIGVQQLPVHFIKSTCFRVIHANGVWYGGDGQGNLHMTFFNERNPIPKTLVLNVDQNGTVVGETQRESKIGIVREMEVDIVLSFTVALEIYRTLGENLKSIQENIKNQTAERMESISEVEKNETRPQ